MCLYVYKYTNLFKIDTIVSKQGAMHQLEHEMKWTNRQYTHTRKEYIEIIISFISKVELFAYINFCYETSDLWRIFQLLKLVYNWTHKLYNSTQL